MKKNILSEMAAALHSMAAVFSDTVDLYDCWYDDGDLMLRLAELRDLADAFREKIKSDVGDKRDEGLRYCADGANDDDDCAGYAAAALLHKHRAYRQV